ncbi:long-chain fatty acid--CoA ligase [Gordonia sp. TBRC 11910]|uniref:Long-chain fatty acid--CoA ligase n=1 Tax=Gordonia asplenii TaxID=2725283 RepID=A0A848L8Y4_9ACTN|nr:AMP-binding protein [Gordonia asplenii]NMO04048.1 long-chain fatty acid--CoA ligase [Gordonia asplenii]
MDIRMWESIASMTEHWAVVQPDAIAVASVAGHRQTFAGLDRRASQLSTVLAGIPGPIAYVGADPVTWAEIMVAASKTGIAAVPINWRLSPSEVDRLLRHCRPTVVVADVAFAALVNPALSNESVTVVFDAERDRVGEYADWGADGPTEVPARDHPADEDVLLMYTSGTSGTPKAVRVTNGQIAANLAAASPWVIDDNSVICVPAPLFHLSGTGWLFYCLGRGARFVGTGGASPASVLATMVEVGATHMLTVPAILQEMVRVPEAATIELPQLQTLIYAGSPMPPALIVEAQSVLGCDFIQSYGMTETCGPITFLDIEDHRTGGARLASAGRPAAGVEIAVRVPGTAGDAAIGETGEVWTRSPLVTPGYWQNDEDNVKAFDADRWFRTGDAGHLDADGYLYLTDRMSDMIITGGENVYPVEIENVLAEHPAVSEVGVFGMPHHRWGETVVAVVVAADATDPDPRELIAYCRERIAHYKCPTHVEVVNELPRTASGKVVKHRLPDLVAERADT